MSLKDLPIVELEKAFQRIEKGEVLYFCEACSEIIDVVDDEDEEEERCPGCGTEGVEEIEQDNLEEILENK